MSMIVDQYGNKGLDRHGLGEGSGPDGRLQPDEVDTRGQGIVSAGPSVKVHTLAQETKGLPSDDNRLWGACLKDDKQIKGITNEKDCTDRGIWNDDVLRRDDEFKTKSFDDILTDLNNGRVSDVNLRSNVYDKLTKKTIDRHVDVLIRNDNQETAVKGIVEETSLSKYFLSPENTQVIQDTLRYRVHQKTQQVIDYQSPQELYIVMRSVLLQHGNFRINPTKLSQEIRALNSHVLKYCVNEVSSNVQQYQGYIKDLEKLPHPMDRPRFTEGTRMDSYDLSARNKGMSS